MEMGNARAITDRPSFVVISGPRGGQVGQPAHDADEIGRVALPLETDQVGAQQPLDHLIAATANAWTKISSGGKGM